MALPFRYNALSLFARPTSTLSSMGLIAVVIAAFAYLQAVTDSAFNTLAATGDANTVIVLYQAADSETVSGLGKDDVNKLETTPGAVRGEKGPILSPEMVAISSAFTSEEDDVAVNIAVRGVDFVEAAKVRQGRVKMVEGRPFQPGADEVIVGESASKLYVGHKLGDEIELGTRGMRKFKIVGVFSTGGTASDSEVWGYVETLRDVYSRDRYSSVRMLASDEQAAQTMINHIQGPSVGFTAKTETDYFRHLNTNQRATQVLSFSMIVIMGIAAAFAVANTMYASVAGRTREIGMLRALGFSRVNLLTAFVFEGILLAVAGGVAGAAISFVSHGMRKNMLPATFTTVSYALEITPKIIWTSLAVALVIGLVGSMLPALRAARMDVITALRDA